MKKSIKNPASYLALPPQGDYRPEAVRAWFGNVRRELDVGVYSDEERALFEEYYLEAGLLRPWRRPFFWRHYAEALSRALTFLFDGSRTPTILDLGCGTGTQSLLFALHGATVVAVDMDPIALRVFRRRLDLYQDSIGRVLPVTIIEGNAFEFDYKAARPFDGVYSLFAFNMMQPSEKLVDTLLPHLAEAARWAVLDGNSSSVWAKLLPSRRRCVWSPSDMARQLGLRGFSIVSQEGGVALPPPVWTVMPYGLARAVDRKLCASLFWPISCQTMAVRRGA